jgi:DNA invertase Pin-like site-specific DNA recombinase
MASSGETLVVARDLVRVSRDRSGREKSPDDQHADHERSAMRLGWVLRGPSYRDIGSASEFATKARVNFERLIDDLERDKFAASILMMWENSRGSRRESEWLRLIELAVERKVKFWIDVRGRLMDPADPHDRRDLVHAAADAAFESGMLSERILRGTASAALDGLPHGRIPYGYRRRYDEHTRKFVAQEVEPAEAAAVLELFERVDKGHSLYSICNDFRERGIEKRGGGAFTQQHLRTLLVNPSYIAERVHDVNRRRGGRVTPKAIRTPGAWPAIIDKPLYQRVQRRLADPARKKTRDATVRHLYSGIALCGICGAVCRVRPRSSGSGFMYSCGAPSGCARAPKDELEDFAQDVVLGYLADPANYGCLEQPGEDPSAELAKLAIELEEADGDLRELRADWDAGRIRPASFARAESAAEDRLDELTARESALRAPVAPDGLVAPGPDVAARWKAADLTAKRATLRAVLVPNLIGELRVYPVGPGNRKPTPPIENRVKFVDAEGCDKSAVTD